MKSLTILPLADTPNLIVREIESYDVKAFAGFMMQPRYQRYTAMRLRSDAEVAAFVLRSVARQGDDRRNVFHLAAEERSSGEAIGDGFLIMQRDRTIELGWGVHPAMWSCGFGTEIRRHEHETSPHSVREAQSGNRIFREFTQRSDGREFRSIPVEIPSEDLSQAV